MKIQQLKWKTMREKADNIKKAKVYDDYDWVELYRSLYATELNKYLTHHGMGNKTSLPK
jgi:hypothetical protein